MLQKTKSENMLGKSTLIVLCVFSCILAVCFSVSYDLMGKAGQCVFDAGFVARFIASAVLVSLLFYGCIWALKRSSASLRMTGFLKLTPMKQVVLLSALLLLCWSPYIVLLYPGNLYYDTAAQFMFFFSLLDTGNWATVRLQHPIFATFVFGAIMKSVYSATGNAQMAIFSITLIQSACTAAAFASIFAYFIKAKMAPNWLFAACFVFLALCPLVPINVCAISKDAFFSWAYVFFLLSALTILDKGASIKSIVAFTAVALLVSLTKKFGIYVSEATCFGIAIACWRQGIKAILSMAVPAVTCIGIVSVLLPGLLGMTNVQKDGAQEMLSVPLQQSALAYINHGSSMSDEEIAVLGKVMLLDSVTEDYTPQCADGIKGYNPRTDAEGYREYLSLWVEQGFKYPKDYLDAWASLEAPLFARTMLPIFDSNHTPDSDFLPVGYQDKPIFAENAALFFTGLYEWFTDLPVINFFFYPFPYVFLAPMILALSIIESRKWHYLAILVPLVVSIAGLMLSPITGTTDIAFEAMRYLIPFVYSAPILLMFSQRLLQPEPLSSPTE